MPIYPYNELRDEFERQLNLRANELSIKDRLLVQNLFEKLPAEVELNPLERSPFLPLLLVLPFATVPFERQIESVQYAPAGSDSPKQPIYSFLKSENITDEQELRGEEIPVSVDPYLILGIDDGTYTQGLSPNQALRKLACAGYRRLALTVSQGIALAIRRPVIFDHHNMHLSGSRILDSATHEPFVPDFWVYGGRIKMKRDSADDADPRWGTPSYQEVITL